MRFICSFILIISILSKGYAQLSEQDKEKARVILDQIVLFDNEEGIDYRKQLLENASDIDKRNWKKTIAPWTTLDWDMEPAGNNLYLLILQKHYFATEDKNAFLDTISNNLDVLRKLEGFLKGLERDQWLLKAIIQTQKLQNYWISFKENLLKFKSKDNRLLYSVRFLIANESIRLFKHQFLQESEFSSWICDNIKKQRDYRSEFNASHPNKEHEEEAKVLFDTEEWLIAFINEENPSISSNKDLQSSLKLIYQKYGAFYFKNNAANDWWMLVAFCNDMSFQSRKINTLDFLIKKLEYPESLSDDEVAYYLMAICSEFTITYAKKMGMDLVNLEHQSVIKKAEQSKMLTFEKLNVWRMMNYDRNQIAHGYDKTFNSSLRKKITKYLTLIKENKL